MSSTKHFATDSDRVVAIDCSAGHHSIFQRYIAAVVFLSLLFSATTKADFQPLTLPELFTGSGLIVLGVIDSFDENSFTLQQTEVFFGRVGSAPIRVKKYVDWPGGLRWSTYRAGQQVLLFLRQATNDKGAMDKLWQIRGFGGEGEMPISEGAIFVHGVNLKDFERQKHQIEGGSLYSYRFEKSVFESALKGYLRCFDDAKAKATVVSKGLLGRCSERERLSYQMSSQLHCFLAKSRQKLSK